MERYRLAERWVGDAILDMVRAGADHPAETTYMKYNDKTSEILCLGQNTCTTSSGPYSTPSLLWPALNIAITSYFASIRTTHHNQTIISSGKGQSI